MLSCWPFTVTEDGTAILTTPGGRAFAIHNVHLAASPYGPYTAARELKVGAAASEAAVTVTKEAEELRQPEIDGWRRAVETQTAAGRSCLLTGDFNEPSHLAWDGKTGGRLAVEWPCSTAAAAAGLADCYHQDALACGRPVLDSWTWSWPRYLAQTSHSEAEFIATHGEINDRIDYVYLGNPSADAVDHDKLLRLVRCVLVCESLECAEVADAPWPSDHAALLATFAIGAADGGHAL